MGYDLHITRAEDWLDSKQHPILESEWLAVVHADPALEVDTLSYSARRTAEGTTERHHPIAWIGHPDSALVRPNFWYEDGKISGKGPDDPTLKKMIEIARKLNARVMGDDAEEYDEVGGRIQVQGWTSPLEGGAGDVVPSILSRETDPLSRT